MRFDAALVLLADRAERPAKIIIVPAEPRPGRNDDVWG